MKSQNKKKLTNDEIGILFLLAALLFGGWFRIYPAMVSEFPINDGGLFMVAIESIQNNQFRLPMTINYNTLEIPFAYPPLAFYLAGYLGLALKISVIELLKWIPAIVLVLTLPCVYYLGTLFLKSKLLAGVATFLYSVTPRSITWMIMGGGITRSIGQLFLILAISQVYQLYNKGDKKYIYSSILFSAIVCLTHPEATLHTLAIVFILWIFYGRNARGIKYSFIVGAGVLLLTSPWWLTVLSRYGVGPFIAASQTGLYDPFIVLFIFTPISEEPLITYISALAILGLFIQIKNKDFLLPMLFVLPFLIEPRNALNVAIIPLSMLAAIGLFQMVISNQLWTRNVTETLETKPLIYSWSQKIFLALILSGTLLGMSSFELELLQKQVSKDARQTFEWIKRNTKSDAEFLLITGNEYVFSDYLNEWFPILTQRRTHTAIQGYEWIRERDFSKQATMISNFQLCINDATPDKCIENTAEHNNISFDYLQIQKKGIGTSTLVSSVIRSSNYELEYESTDYVIFKYLK